MTRIQAGDQDAAAALHQRYVHRLIGLAREHLALRVRQKLDPEDVVQSVFRTFFRRQKEGQFDFGGWDDLWNLLALITLRKCGSQVRHFASARRDARKEFRPVLSPDDSDSWQAIARGPTPEETAMLVETVEQILVNLKERERPIFLLGLQGFTAREISAMVGRSERTVYRILEYIKEELERSRDEGPLLSPG
jgi:RNA polymerase sigma-70 factor (ECF subfamily)